MGACPTSIYVSPTLRLDKSFHLKKGELSRLMKGEMWIAGALFILCSYEFFPNPYSLLFETGPIFEILELKFSNTWSTLLPRANRCGQHF